MANKKGKKNAFTLVEVVVSLAIISLLIIPSMNMIVQSTKSIQKSKEREQAELLGKEVIEEIKAIDLSSIAAPSNGGTPLTKTLTSGLTLNNIRDDAGNYNNKIVGEELIDGKYEVKVNLKKRSEISFERESEKYDSELEIYFEGTELKILEPISGQIVTLSINADKTVDPIIITNTASKIRINIFTNEITKTVNIPTGSAFTPGSLRVNLQEATQDVEIKFEVKNENTDEFNLFLSRRKGTGLKTSEKLNDDSIGAVVIGKEEFTEDNIGDLFDITVTVNKKGETNTLFTGNAYKNIILK